VDLRQIDCFLAVATDLHFGKAAERLALAQSSVSEAIRTLEHEVGGPLFVRTSRRVQLTPLGEKLRLGVEPAALVLRATLDDCRKTALGVLAVGAGIFDTRPHLRCRLTHFDHSGDAVRRFRHHCLQTRSGVRYQSSWLVAGFGMSASLYDAHLPASAVLLMTKVDGPATSKTRRSGSAVMRLRSSSRSKANELTVRPPAYQRAGRR
jgi:hypothetical protein